MRDWSEVPVWDKTTGQLRRYGMSVAASSGQPIPSCDPASTPLVLFCGGTSNERPISLLSGAAATAALRGEGFVVTILDPAEETFLSQLETAVSQGVKAAFICLHGKGGEDGTMQGLCEIAGIHYTGPGVLASALAMDKALARMMFVANNLPMANAVIVHRGQSIPAFEEITTVVGEKCVVKPASEGSAIGVTISHTPAELPQAIANALAIGETAIVEEFIAGTELTVAVLGNDDPFALPVIEIVARNEFYDYDAKYSEGGAQHIIPARIPDEVTVMCQELAVQAHRVLGCKGLSRSDMIVDADGRPWLLEVNTIPGMTATSLLPDAAAHQGISFGKLCHMLVDYAFDVVR
jgi:D-alanine-D-alanine ligase